MKGQDPVLMIHFKEELPMLVLTRRVGEKVRIGADVVITVLEVQGSRIRVGIEAPSDVPVFRSELLGAPPAGRRVVLNFETARQGSTSSNE